VALRAYVENCVGDDGCFLGNTVDEGLGTIQDLIAGVDEEPLPTRDPDRDLAVGNASTGWSRRSTTATTGRSSTSR
jgi:hypothetical protein